MTFETSLVVISCVFAKRLVRVVTRRAAYVPVVRVTFAVKNAIRLEANVVDFHALQQRKLFRASMTRSAKLLRQFVATHQAGIEDRLCRCVTCFNGRDVLPAWSMTSFTAHAVCELFQTQL
jgi:hypothetical protein